MNIFSLYSEEHDKFVHLPASQMLVSVGVGRGKKSDAKTSKSHGNLKETILIAVVID